MTWLITHIVAAISEHRVLHDNLANAALRRELAARTEEGEYWHAQAIANAKAVATANTSLAAAQSRVARGADHMPDSPWRRVDE